MEDPYVNLRHMILAEALAKGIDMPAEAAARVVEKAVEDLGAETVAHICRLLDEVV